MTSIEIRVATSDCLTAIDRAKAKIPGAQLELARAIASTWKSSVGKAHSALESLRREISQGEDVVAGLEQLANEVEQCELGIHLSELAARRAPIAAQDAKLVAQIDVLDRPAFSADRVEKVKELKQKSHTLRTQIGDIDREAANVSVRLEMLRRQSTGQPTVEHQGSLPALATSATAARHEALAS